MMAEIDPVALQKTLDSGNPKNCLKFFHGMSEKARREYFRIVKPFWNKIRKNQFIEDPPSTFKWNPRASVAETAYFATASGAEIKNAKRSGYPEMELAFAILADRKPDWIDEWVESLLKESFYWNHWHLIRRLIAAGLAKKPDSPRYYLGMISAINGRMNKVPLVKALQEAPDLLKEDIWKLFEYDGDGENSLANTERFDQSWISAFLILVDQGKLPRHRLLEASIDALERDFNHYRAKWYFELFDRLEPTDAELKKFGDRILGLLGASAPNVASWALARVQALATSGEFTSPTMCHSMEPILRARAKGTVLTALKLLERQATTFPNDAPLISIAVAKTLAHESPDVQRAAVRLLDLISSPEDRNLRSIVEKRQPQLAASVRSSVSKWLSKTTAMAVDTVSDGQPSQQRTTREKLPAISSVLETLYSIDVLKKNRSDGVFAIPAAVFDGTDIPRLALVQRMTPIEDIEELIDVCARVIEDGSLVDDAERCIDAFARLCDAKNDGTEAMCAPLLKRTRKLLQKGSCPFCGVDPANDLMGLFYAFCTGNVIEPTLKSDRLHFELEGDPMEEYSINTKKPIGFLSAHCLAVAKRIATRNAFQLLSTPTHQGGWIDPRDLAKRVNAWNGTDPDMHDVILAMLRLAPENRDDALKSLSKNPSEWHNAIRHALGADKVVIGKAGALWAAAARARSPWQVDPQVQKKHPSMGPDTGEMAEVTIQFKCRKSGPYTFYESSFSVQPEIPKNVDPLLVTVQMHSSRALGRDYFFEMGGFAGRTNGAVRWTATIWPLARESFFAASADNCFDNLDWSEAQWQNRTMLECLLDAGTPLRYAGNLFLVGMLAAKEPGESGLATDIAIHAIESGRLGSNNLGAALSILLQSGLIKPGRWQKTLAEVARSSPVHAAVVQIALQQCFSDPLKSMQKDSAKLLELLFELSSELGVPVTSEPCQKWLASGAATGKSSKLAKGLLALSTLPNANESIQRILEQSIAQRTKAANRMQ